MIVGPMTEAIWPIAGPTKDRPAPWHTVDVVPPVAPWPWGPGVLAHAPPFVGFPARVVCDGLKPGHVKEDGVANDGMVNDGIVNGVLALATGAPPASAAVAASALTSVLRKRVIGVGVLSSRSDSGVHGVVAEGPVFVSGRTGMPGLKCRSTRLAAPMSGNGPRGRCETGRLGMGHVVCSGHAAARHSSRRGCVAPGRSRPAGPRSDHDRLLAGPDSSRRC
jgi:hypothetical protein